MFPVSLPDSAETGSPVQKSNGKCIGHESAAASIRINRLADAEFAVKPEMRNVRNEMIFIYTKLQIFDYHTILYVNKEERGRRSQSFRPVLLF